MNAASSTATSVSQGNAAAPADTERSAVDLKAIAQMVKKLAAKKPEPPRPPPKPNMLGAITSWASTIFKLPPKDAEPEEEEPEEEDVVDFEEEPVPGFRSFGGPLLDALDVELAANVSKMLELSKQFETNPTPGTEAPGLIVADVMKLKARVQAKKLAFVQHRGKMAADERDFLNKLSTWSEYFHGKLSMTSVSAALTRTKVWEDRLQAEVDMNIQLMLRLSTQFENNAIPGVEAPGLIIEDVMKLERRAFEKQFVYMMCSLKILSSSEAIRDGLKNDRPPAGYPAPAAGVIAATYPEAISAASVWAVKLETEVDANIKKMLQLSTQFENNSLPGAEAPGLIIEDVMKLETRANEKRLAFLEHAAMTRVEERTTRDGLRRKEPAAYAAAQTVASIWADKLQAEADANVKLMLELSKQFENNSLPGKEAPGLVIEDAIKCERRSMEKTLAYLEHAVALCKDERAAHLSAARAAGLDQEAFDTAERAFNSGKGAALNQELAESVEALLEASKEYENNALRGAEAPCLVVEDVMKLERRMMEEKRVVAFRQHVGAPS